MKPMNKAAQRIFNKLIAPLTEDNPHRKIGEKAPWPTTTSRTATSWPTRK
jgi:hypothetical protein